MMKKYILLLFILSICAGINGQVIRTDPSVAYPGQTVTPTIVLSPGVMQNGAPTRDSDIYIQQDTFRIYTDLFTTAQIYPAAVGYSDSLFTDFSIPLNAIPGWYDVHVITQIFGFPVDNVMPYGFLVRLPGSCPVPFNVSADTLTGTMEYITWSPTVIADTFRIRYRQHGTTNYYYKDIDGTGNVSSDTLKNLYPGFLYDIDISTRCNGVSSTYSIPIDTFTTLSDTIFHCVVPFGITFSSVTNTLAQVDWSNFITADTFRIRYYEVGTSNYFYKDVDGSGPHSTNLSNLKPSTTYNLQISSKCLGVGNGYSNTYSFTTGPGQVSCVIPWGVNVTNITGSSVMVRWTPDLYADVFRIHYKKFIGGPDLYVNVNGISGDSALLPNLFPNTLYTYEVSSVCSGVSSGYSATQSFTTLNVVASCQVPYSLSATNLTNSSARINWTNLVSADTFRIRYSVFGTTNYLYKNSPGTSGNFTTITLLMPNTTYQYQVSSVCVGTGTGYSASQTFTTLNIPVACAIPYGLVSNVLSNVSANLSWTNLVTADSFLIRYAVNGTTNYYWKKIVGTGGSSTVLTGLAPNTTYKWQVRSICNGIPTSTYSSPDIFGTPLRLAGSAEETSGILLYPNPAMDELNIHFSSDEEQSINISIVDLSGRTVLNEERKAVRGENDFQTSVSTFASGVYLVSIKNKDVVFRSKLIVGK